MIVGFRECALARAVACGSLVLAVLLPAAPRLADAQQAKASSASNYFPPRHDWQRRTAEQVGMDPKALADAVAFVQTRENPATRDQALMLTRTFGASEPHFGGIIGPTKPRSPINGVIIRQGYVVAEWGDTQAVDMAHSVVKTMLSSVVGLAWQQGLICDLNDRVGPYMPRDVDLFEAPHNQAITWDHLLRQTSDWQGTLWGKPDWADRPEGDPASWSNRKLHAPGTRFKYNDVRINVLALAALHVWRRPLPEVFKREIMDPIGASSKWRWHGYDNSWIELDGQRMQSVSGGGHWGGGMFIDAWDMARFGYLHLRGGKWDGRQLVSPEWIRLARTPGAVNAEYGFANWYLNTNRKRLAAAPVSAVTFNGNGQNIIYIDAENDLLIVVRWIDRDPALNDFVSRVLAAIR
ncbi:MAG: serine hydrolase domain-containing protein [Burkholderiales bacterium]